MDNNNEIIIENQTIVENEDPGVNMWGVLGFVLAIFGLITACFGVGFFISLISAILCIVGMCQAEKSKVMSIIGLVISVFGLLFGVYGVIIMLSKILLMFS